MNFEKYSYYLGSIFTLLLGTKDPFFILREFSGMASTNPKILRLRASDLCFQVRNKMDVWSIKETFLDRFYERFGVPIEDGWRIIDIGGGIGDYTIFAAYAYPHNRVIAFEPFRNSFELLQLNLKLNQIKNVELFPEAISGSDGVLYLELEDDALQIKSVGTIESNADGKYQKIKAISLENAISRSGIERCDLLKLDCEGAEYDILFNAPPEIFHKISRIIMEYHDGVVKYDHTALADFLRKKGYTVRTQKNFVHDNLGYLSAVKA
jgi:FkbM family methyltransferase